MAVHNARHRIFPRRQPEHRHVVAALEAQAQVAAEHDVAVVQPEWVPALLFGAVLDSATMPTSMLESSQSLRSRVAMAASGSSVLGIVNNNMHDQAT